LEGFAEKEGFKPEMKERVGDGTLIITSMSLRWFCSPNNDFLGLRIVIFRPYAERRNLLVLTVVALA